MRRFQFCLSVVAAAVAMYGLCGVASAGMAARHLRVESLVAPCGVDLPRPRLSWQVAGDARGTVQSAYRVLVASSAATLAENEGDLWDSGKCATGDSLAIVYAGKPLASHQRCHWKVMLWDGAGQESTWSEPAEWAVGLLNPQADWKAEWIGFDKHRVAESAAAPLDGAKWIWHAADPAEAPKGPRLLVGAIALPAAAKLSKAELCVTADDSFKFVVNGTLVAATEPGNDGWKTAVTADVTPHLVAGANSLRVEVTNAAVGPAGLLAKLTVTFADGTQAVCVTDGAWKSLAEPGANWHNRELDTAAWPAVKVLGEHGAEPWRQIAQKSLFLPPPPHLCAGFRLDKPVKQATLYATALGNCDVYVNGKRVSEERFAPGWTDYAKRVYYRAYDVTSLLTAGDNAWGAVLADGWYSGYIGWGRVRNHYGKLPRFAGQLHVEFADGSATTIATDATWKAKCGPTVEADFLMGEAYDARLEDPNWCTAGADRAGWEAVVTGAEVQPALSWHPGPPVLPYATFAGQQVTAPAPGAYVVDMGQNFAGVARLKVRGKPGQKLTLRFAERLNPDGTFYVTNLRGARAVDTYICRGGGEEVWEPRFTFHGFQFVEIGGLDAQPAADTITGVAFSSATPVVGEFECSDPMLNRLRQNVYFTQRSNFIDIPTDCPQRDERLGWTGDAQTYIRAAALNTDVQAFFTKWLVDLEDGQRADGQFPMVAPVKVAGDDGGPAWADAGVICPLAVYDVYADRRILEAHYEGMVRFVEFCRGRSTPDLLPPAQFHCFGDWLSIKADTPTPVIYTAYFAHSARLTARAAEVLGRADDAAKYRELSERVKAAFNKAYVQADGRIAGDTQTAYLLAIAFDLVEGERRAQAAAHLVANIESRGWRLSTGFVGTKDLMHALTKIGRDDVAFRLLHNEEFPSWGFSIRHGATSIWERWDGWTPENGFQDPGMNSFAHYSFGAVYQWMVENIGGIRTDGPGYARIVIAPKPDAKLTWAKTRYESVRGPIASAWKRAGRKFELTVEIPANTQALVVLPALRDAPLLVDGKPLAEAADVKLVSREAGQAVLAIGSGTYRVACDVQPIALPE